MRRIFLTERMGYVARFEELIPYILELINNKIKSSLLLNRIDLNQKDKMKIAMEYFNNKDIDRETPITDIVLKEATLNAYNVFNIEKIVISFTLQDDIMAAFDSSYTRLKNNGKISRLDIIINPIYVIINFKKLGSSLQHEFTHAYELIRRYHINTEEKTDNEITNRYYKANEDNFVNLISYYLSKVEINAYISEFYHEISSKRVPRCNLRQEYEKTELYDIINEIKDIKHKLENDINYTLDVIEFLKLHPEHVDMFPSIKRHSINSYRKRLINVVDIKLGYIYKKMHKIIGYLYRG